ncbi:hypothetical protein [Adlercreutzia sp. ZJ305]|uniref:hypothetical protein n=1 Tax=Adlercreutzia sp. ZJ305 TaxID=2709408 RepID=UPI0013EA4432|nr:hypothetical protein [Adlercreutzia sp. ZJ305]
MDVRLTSSQTADDANVGRGTSHEEGSVSHGAGEAGRVGDMRDALVHVKHSLSYNPRGWVPAISKIDRSI